MFAAVRPGRTARVTRRGLNLPSRLRDPRYFRIAVLTVLVTLGVTVLDPGVFRLAPDAAWKTRPESRVFYPGPILLIADRRMNLNVATLEIADAFSDDVVIRVVDREVDLVGII